jgi:hypothetical protein
VILGEKTHKAITHNEKARVTTYYKDDILFNLSFKE